MRNFKTGIIGGLFYVVTPSAVIATVAFLIFLAIIGIFIFDLEIGSAVFGAILGVGLHWLSEIWHQKGHALAARRSGYPMVGVRLWLLLGASLYPRDEPEVSADVHIQRALGGPIASFILVLIALLLVLAVTSAGGAPLLLAKFFLLENIFVFFLGAFIPLGFTDGDTLLKYWPERTKSTAK